MKETRMIYFEYIPPNFKNNELVQVVQYEFSGIQTFIWGETTIFSTSEIVRQRSQYIIDATEKMAQWLNERFSRFDRYRVLSKSSGKLIIAVSSLTSVKKISRLSDEIQRIIYASTDGKLEMHYGFCKARVSGKCCISTLNNVTSELARNVNWNKYHCTNIVGISFSDYNKKEFVPPVISTETTANTLQSSATEVTVAIKLDLDNLGSFFQKMIAFDARRAASEALSNILHHVFDSLDGLDPIFVGGDDFFAISKLDRYLELLSEIYQRIKQSINTCDELMLYREHFGLSGGIAFIRNDLGSVPLLYYYEESERSLEMAKAIPGKNAVVIPAPNIVSARKKNTDLTWQQLASIYSIMAEHKETILKGVSAQQRYVLFTNIKELANRILSINRSHGGKLLSREEVYDVSNI